VLAKLIDGLRPGDWLVVEDYDLRTISVTVPPSDSWSATDMRQGGRNRVAYTPVLVAARGCRRPGFRDAGSG
jgi:hypothetical protein